MFSMDNVKEMNDTFKDQKDALTKELDIATKKWVLMDDLSVAVEYVTQAVNMLDNLGIKVDEFEISEKLYNMPTELSSLVMLPIDDINEIWDKVLAFVKANVPGIVKLTVNVQKMFTIRDLTNEYSDVVSDDTVFRRVSDIIHYLQFIQIWFACKHAISFGDEKKVVVTRNINIDTDNKVGANINDFAKELANIHGYESFDDMTDDEKYMALTLWRDHIKTSASNIDE